MLLNLDWMSAGYTHLSCFVSDKVFGFSMDNKGHMEYNMALNAADKVKCVL